MTHKGVARLSAIADFLRSSVAHATFILQTTSVICVLDAAKAKYDRNSPPVG